NSAAAVFASRAEIPIRIAPVTSFSSAQRPVSSSSSSHRASCFGSSVLPSVRNVVTTSVRVGGGGLLWRRWSSPALCSRYPPPWPSPTRGEGTERVIGVAASAAAGVAAAASEFLRGDRSGCCAAPSPLVGEGWGGG